MIKTEVLIVGGGPAGSACTKRLRELGVDCLILDRQTFPRPKPCAGWVTPQVFNHLGVSPEQYPHGLTHFNSFQVSIKGIKFSLPTHQYAIRRVAFDAWLLDLAGADPIQHRVEEIQKVETGFVIDNKFQSKFLVGAGGTHCPVRRHFFLPKQKNGGDGLIIAKEEEFTFPATDSRCHLWFFEEGLPGYAWYVPKTGGYLNIGIGASAAGLKHKKMTLNEYWEKFVQKLNAMNLVNGRRFTPSGYSYYLRQKRVEPQKGNILLIGDSLGLATKDMGEGIGPAIQSGILAAEAINRRKRSYSTKSIPRYSLGTLLGLRR
ncbi:MAG: NAD(P)/FAD-dependent oxidoreductase [Brevefilum sp.]